MKEGHFISAWWKPQNVLKCFNFVLSFLSKNSRIYLGWNGYLSLNGSSLTAKYFLWNLSDSVWQEAQLNTPALSCRGAELRAEGSRIYSSKWRSAPKHCKNEKQKPWLKSVLSEFYKPCCSAPTGLHSKSIYLDNNQNKIKMKLSL